MKHLKLNPNLERHDDLFEKLVSVHEGLDNAESRKIDAKIILLLANHIGDINVLSEAIDMAAGLSDQPTQETGNQG